MQREGRIIATFITILLLSMLIPLSSSANEAEQVNLHSKKETHISVKERHNFSRFTYDSGYDFEYPDAVRGIYVTGNSAGRSEERRVGKECRSERWRGTERKREQHGVR